MKAAVELRVNNDPLAGDLCFNQIINEEQGKKLGNMNRTLFAEENMRKLQANPNVQQNNRCSQEEHRPLDS